MQTIEKALHQPMPFTTGGQTITDRLTAAKHSLAGSQLGKTICKATTEELMAPKKKHLDYLLHCTNEPNVSIPSMANLLIERTQNPNWTVVYKSLITIHNIMCYGNERFSQYLASCNTTFNLGSFLDKGSTQGYDMSQHVRRYGKYISEKIYTYRLCAYDFCKVKRGREDGLLRTMNTDKLLKTLPILQNQIDALLEFQVTSGELNNGVINCSFILLFRDLIRLFACYNDGVINLLEKYFDMNKKQCREALDMYKAFLLRLDKVAEFLKVAETVGIDRGEIPDLTRAPASLLEALEAHLIHLEGGKVPPSSNHGEQFAAAMGKPSALFSSERTTGGIEDSVKQKYLEEEKERLRMFEEQRKKQGIDGSAMGTTTSDSSQLFNPFTATATAHQTEKAAEPQVSSKPSDDLLSLFDPVPAPTHITAPAGAPISVAQQQPTIPLDPTNPFAQNIFQQQPTIINAPSGNAAYAGFAHASNSNAFGADFSRAFGAMPATAPISQGPPPHAADVTNPFLVSGAEASASANWMGNEDTTRAGHWPAVGGEHDSQTVQWAPVTQADFEIEKREGASLEWAKGAVGTVSGPGADSSESGDEANPPANSVPPSEAVSSALRNPFGALQQNAQALHTAGVSATVVTPMQPDIPSFGAPASNNSSANPSPVPFGGQSAPQPIVQQGQRLGIYDQTPFSHMDGSYTSSPVFAVHMQAQPVATAHGTPGLDAYTSQPPTSVSPATSQAARFGSGDLDSALSSLADNLSIGSKGTSQGKPVQWNTQTGVRPSVVSAHPLAQVPYGQMPQQWPPLSAFPPQPGMYGQQPVMGVYGQPGYGQVSGVVYGVPPTQAAQPGAPAQPNQHHFL